MINSNKGSIYLSIYNFQAYNSSRVNIIKKYIFKKWYCDLNASHFFIVLKHARYKNESVINLDTFDLFINEIEYIYTKKQIMKLS